MRAIQIPHTYVISSSVPDGRDAKHFVLTPVGVPPAAQVQPGQFMMLGLPGVGEVALTYLSLPDAQGRIEVLVRSVGKVTHALHEAGVGTRVGVRGPMGQGWPAALLSQRNVWVIGGGCGLAPLSPAVDAMLDAGVAPRLLYAARNPQAQVLGHHRARWHEQLDLIETCDQIPDDSPLSRCSIESPQACLQRLLRENNAPKGVLCCGPEAFMCMVAETLTAAGVPAGDIWLSLERRMHCGVGTCGHCYLDELSICEDGPTLPWSRLAGRRSVGRPTSALHTCY